MARLGAAPYLRDAPVVAGVLHVLIGAAVVLGTPLAAPWKGLIVASSAAVMIIPPLTWRLLQRSHETEMDG